MAAGNQPTQASVNQMLTNVAVQMRNIMDLVRVQETPIVNMGTAGLEALGFSSADAASVLALWGYLSTVAGVYYGTVQQGGSGGTGASTFNFDNALSEAWGGQ
jgi:hypothetical protein